MDRRGVHAGCLHRCPRCDAAMGDRTQAHRSAPASALSDAAVGDRRQTHRAHRRRPVGEVRWRPSAVQSGRSALRRRAAGTGRASKSWFGGCPPTRGAAEGRGARGRRVRRRATSRRSTAAGRGDAGGRCARRWPGSAGCRLRGGCGHEKVSVSDSGSSGVILGLLTAGCRVYGYGTCVGGCAAAG